MIRILHHGFDNKNNNKCVCFIFIQTVPYVAKMYFIGMQNCVKLTFSVCNMYKHLIETVRWNLVSGKLLSVLSILAVK